LPTPKRKAATAHITNPRGNEAGGGRRLLLPVPDEEAKLTMANRNLVGLEVGDLKVVGHWFAETWACRCACGREALVHAGDLVSAQMRSCGCKPGMRRPQRRSGFPDPPRARRR
jgi:hypothetical protein